MLHCRYTINRTFKSRPQFQRRKALYSVSVEKNELCKNCFLWFIFFVFLHEQQRRENVLGCIDASDSEKWRFFYCTEPAY